MKQHIGWLEINTLSNKGLERLRSWTGNNLQTDPDYPEDHADLFLTIGEMIEFLQEYDPNDESYIDQYYQHNLTPPVFANCEFDLGWDGELCDALWLAVKWVLEK